VPFGDISGYEEEPTARAHCLALNASTYFKLARTGSIPRLEDAWNILSAMVGVLTNHGLEELSE
jgi:hypothetical protein